MEYAEKGIIMTGFRETPFGQVAYPLGETKEEKKEEKKEDPKGKKQSR